MKSITLTIIAAAVVSACAITTTSQERSMSVTPVPATVPAVRHEATPNTNLQMYVNPDLHLAAVELGTLG